MYILKYFISFIACTADYKNDTKLTAAKTCKLLYKGEIKQVHIKSLEPCGTL